MNTHQTTLCLFALMATPIFVAGCTSYAQQFATRYNELDQQRIAEFERAVDECGSLSTSPVAETMETFNCLYRIQKYAVDNFAPSNEIVYWSRFFSESRQVTREYAAGRIDLADYRFGYDQASDRLVSNINRIRSQEFARARQADIQSRANMGRVGQALSNAGKPIPTKSPSSSSEDTSPKVIGFLTGESASNFNKICFYNVLGTTYSKNIGSLEICPLTAKF